MQFFKTKIDKPLTFVSCGQFISTEKWIHSKRVIDSFELIIVLKGTLYMQQENERYELKAGDTMLLVPGLCHFGYSASEGEMSFYWFHFYCIAPFSILDSREAFFEKSPLVSNEYFNKFNESILIPISSSVEHLEKILIQFKQLLHVTNSKYYTTLAADYMVTLILVELSQQVIYDNLQTIDTLSESGRRFLSILEWLRININRDVSIEEISIKFDYNKEYLSRMFKHRLGVNVRTYINSMKVLKAKELLCQSNQSIKEIAYAIGFKDEKYFMKLFKEYEQLTPSEYRNAYYKINLNNS